jgi:hypothetical protein
MPSSRLDGPEREDMRGGRPGCSGECRVARASPRRPERPYGIAAVVNSRTCGGRARSCRSRPVRLGGKGRRTGGPGSAGTTRHPSPHPAWTLSGKRALGSAQRGRPQCRDCVDQGIDRDGAGCGRASLERGEAVADRARSRDAGRDVIRSWCREGQDCVVPGHVSVHGRAVVGDRCSLRSRPRQAACATPTRQSRASRYVLAVECLH